MKCAFFITNKTEEEIKKIIPYAEIQQAEYLLESIGEAEYVKGLAVTLETEKLEECLTLIEKIEDNEKILVRYDTGNEFVRFSLKMPVLMLEKLSEELKEKFPVSIVFGDGERVIISTGVRKSKFWKVRKVRKQMDQVWNTYGKSAAVNLTIAEEKIGIVFARRRPILRASNMPLT